MPPAGSGRGETGSRRTAAEPPNRPEPSAGAPEPAGPTPADPPGASFRGFCGSLRADPQQSRRRSMESADRRLKSSETVTVRGF
ncbi:hypothetical protein PSMK_29440 [Phycisphaera mikurensis NBRC 102666]|uniref:Uncharacterized protein n=1 Tax=Phycisphaera mikurensis (strain NBRC 102666 / KCTC 22515 / FYK2301M01) TaxID=1142394 RepID=I0IIL5_PHYMF|nr:hypothetical protein PSMK_29440 [Phycisphaera mikurensis NBRC 102666]